MLARYWFLIALVLVLTVGLLLPAPLAGFVAWLPQNWITAAVLFLMALTVDASTMWQAVRRPTAVLLAVAVNFLLLPLLAWGVAGWLKPADMGTGLLIAASVPSTMASAAVWTRRAGGNDSVAFLVTMVTNTACFLVTPLWILATTGAKAQMQKSPADMILGLALVVVVPILLGQLLRQSPPIGAFATRRKLAISVVDQCGILCIVMAGAVTSGLRLANLAPSEAIGWQAWAGMLASVIGIHLAMLFTGQFLGRILGLSRPDWIAVGFSGSQKTLMVGLHMAATQFGGLTMLPMVAYHVCQLLVDTVIADRLVRTKPEPIGDNRL